MHHARSFANIRKRYIYGLGRLDRWSAQTNFNSFFQEPSALVP